VAQLTRVYQALAGQFQALDKTVKASVTDLYHNQSELQQGMSAAEFNLRAHQKAINAMALELEQIRLLLQAVLPDTQQAAVTPVLEMTDVTLPPEEEGGDPQVVRRVNWPYYHEQVEKDLRILAELEAQRLAEEKAAREAEEARRAEEEAAQKEADIQAEAVIGDEDGDEELPEELAEDGAKEEAQGPPPEDDGLPEGATVFGG
jgi:hypothetical protein